MGTGDFLGGNWDSGGGAVVTSQMSKLQSLALSQGGGKVGLGGGAEGQETTSLSPPKRCEKIE